MARQEFRFRPTPLADRATGRLWKPAGSPSLFENSDAAAEERWKVLVSET